MKTTGQFSERVMPVLIPIEPDVFWAQVRSIIREELHTLQKALPVLPDGAILETPGLVSKPLFKIKEICQLFQVSRPTIYDWIKQGLLQPVKIRSRVFFLRQHIDALLEKLDPTQSSLPDRQTL